VTVERRKYTEEFKREAVHLMETSGKPVAQLARDLGINDNNHAVGELINQAASRPNRVKRVLDRGFSFSQFTTRVRFIAAEVSTNCRWVLFSPR
jgi:hypothetical protein